MRILRPRFATHARSSFRFAAALLATFASGMLPANAQTSRIAQVISSDSPRIAIPHTVSPRALAATDLGEAPADRTLPSVTLRFNSTDAQSSALDALLAAQQNPASPLYRQWLTPEQFGARFGLSTADLARTTTWLQSQGLTVTGVARGRGFLTVSGTVAALNAAFAIDLHTIQLDGEQHIANLTDPTLPSPLAQVVGTITGLNDLRLKPYIHPRYTSSITRSHFIAPGDFYTIYDINPLLTNNINGSGVTIAVAGQTDIALSDIAAFRSASGLPANPPTVKLIGMDPGVPAGGDDQVEASLDVEWSGAVAPSATILYVNSKDVLGMSLTQIIDQDLAPIATISYGGCESGFGSSDITSYNQLFRQAAAQGQTIAGPAGDSGATDCDAQTSVASQGLAVDFPASSPYVTGVGGTMFDEGSGTYWSAGNGAFSGSALSYIPEAVWNETSSANGLSSGGGGASTYFSKPAWQVGPGVPADAARDVPDLAFNAASLHDPYLFCQGGACSNGYRDSSGNLDVVGGTSVSTPAFAGILALLEQKLQTQVGLANPTIYALANSTFYTSVFHDITEGNNDSPCTIGTPDCTTVTDLCDSQSNTGKGCIGFNATTGYDLTTGWGSLDVSNFVNDWPLVTPLATGGNASATTVTASAASVPQGAAVTLTVTATITSASSSISATPSGDAQLTLDGVATGGTMPITTGTATFTYNTGNLSPGTHAFGVTYPGNAIYSSSHGSVNVGVLPPTTTTLSGGPASVNSQQTVSYIATVAGSASGTPTGTVQFVRTSGSVAIPIGAPVTLSSGTATLLPTLIPAGTYNITAVYSGDVNFAGSTSAPSPLTVTALPTATSLALPSSPSVTSTTPETFVATVAPSGGATGTPTGTVQFKIDGVVQGSPVTLTGNTATSPGLTFIAGSHAVTAVYSGDNTFAASTSGFDIVTSTITPTTTAFTPAPPATLSSTATVSGLTATVSGLSATVSTSAGVTFLDGTTILGTSSAPSSGTTLVATLTAGPFNAGTHTITARFNGDNTYAPSTSAVATIIVAGPGTVSLSPVTASLTLTAGLSTTDVVNVAASGFIGTQNLTCAVNFNGTGEVTHLPTCLFTPASVTFTAGGAITLPSTLSIATVATSAVKSGPVARNRSLSLTALGGITLASLILIVLPRRARGATKAARLLASLLFLAASFATLSGCGGGGGGGSSTVPPIVLPGTTPGSYDITINANSALNQPGNVGFSGTIPLTIQ